MQKLTCVTALLCAVTLVLCIVMTFHSLNGAELIGCGAGSSCDSVLSGRWSKLFGFFPVSGLAVALYTAALFCLLCTLFFKDEETLCLARMALLVMAGAIIGSVIWFIFLQIHEGTFCKYCMSAHTLGIIVATLILIGFLGKTVRGGWLLSGGLALAAALAGIQASTVPEYVYQEGSSEADLPVIKAVGHPVVGNPDAEYVVDLLFDYQCNHCQQLHHILGDIVEALDERVAFVLCPSPLSPRCNPYIPHEETHFEGSCDFAKIAMALYSIDKKAFAAFDAWVFENPKQGKWSPRPVADAYLKAAELVSADVLDEALLSDYVREFMSASTELFGRTSIMGKSGIPRFVYANKWVVPDADTTGDIISILAKEFGIR